MKMANWEGPYSASSRFQEGSGTNPEELLAAAHAGCFSMAFSKALADAGHIPNRIHTTARVHIEKINGGYGVTKVELSTEVDVPGIEDDAFQDSAEAAKTNPDWGAECGCLSDNGHVASATLPLHPSTAVVNERPIPCIESANLFTQIG